MPVGSPSALITKRSIDDDLARPPRLPPLAALATIGTATLAGPAAPLDHGRGACPPSPGWGPRRRSTPTRRPAPPRPSGPKGQYLSAGKKFLDTTHSAFRAVTAIRGKADAHWKWAVSLPFPEPGVRLIRHDAVESFAAQMADYKLRAG